jgi:hypothetical protein
MRWRIVCAALMASAALAQAGCGIADNRSPGAGIHARQSH